MSLYWLVLASIIYYGWWNPVYLILIVLSMIFNFTIGTHLNKKRSYFLLVLGVTINLVFLCYYKYVDFFLENLNYVFNSQIPFLNVALPLGISFFTFQQIAYLVDSYRKETTDYHFVHYSLFVTFFPQLIAGPIVHHKEMMPQFEISENLSVNNLNIAKGISIFILGLFKKVVIADTFAIWATRGFDQTDILNLHEAWITALSYTFQLYFDFSGYTDMAMGGALMFNIILPWNFNSPYKAQSIQDFWRRWHMTLSRFLRDYLYIPLGGNRLGETRTYINLFLTFCLGGLWHGASWMFVIWGAIHGLGLVIHRYWQRFEIKIPQFLSWLMTFIFVIIAWVYFRALSLEDSHKVIKGMAGLGSSVDHQSFKIEDQMWIWIIVALLVVSRWKNSNTQVEALKLSWKNLLVTTLMFLMSVHIMLTQGYSEFLYRFF